MKIVSFFILLFLMIRSGQAQPLLFIQGASMDTPSLYLQQGADLTLQGDIRIDQAGSDSAAFNAYLQNNGIIHIVASPLAGRSNFVNNVNGLKTFTAGHTTGEIIFAANLENQSLSGTGTVEFMNLTVNSTLSPTLDVQEGTTVDGVLTIGGIINLNDRDLTLTSSGTLAGEPFSSAKMIKADSSGQFVRGINSGAGIFLFPIGDRSMVYSPVMIDFSSNALPGALGVNVKPIAHPQINNPQIATDYIKRYWTFRAAGLTDYSYVGNLVCSHADVVGDEANIKFSKWANPWVAQPDSKTALDTLFITSPLNGIIDPLTGDFTGRNSDAVGITNELKAGDWKIYPNPFDDHIFIDGTQVNSDLPGIEISDITGRIVFSKSAERCPAVIGIGLSDLANGIYYLRITTKMTNLIQPVIKQ